MKRLLLALLVLLPALSNGCISVYVVRSKARPHLEFDPVESKVKRVEGEPGYYALLPLAIVADIATAPFQIIYFGGSHSGLLWIDGWPVPVP